jgi:hypothetical protein
MNRARKQRIPPIKSFQTNCLDDPLRCPIRASYGATRLSTPAHRRPIGLLKKWQNEQESRTTNQPA